MKEQASVDEEFIEEVGSLVGMGHVGWDMVPAKDLCEAVIEVYLDKNEEIKRIKRLDENVKLLKRDLSAAIGVDKLAPEYSKWSEFDREAYEYFLELLESLYDETTD